MASNRGTTRLLFNTVQTVSRTFDLDRGSHTYSQNIDPSIFLPNQHWSTYLSTPRLYIDEPHRMMRLAHGHLYLLLSKVSFGTAILYPSYHFGAVLRSGCFHSFEGFGELTHTSISSSPFHGLRIYVDYQALLDTLPRTSPLLPSVRTSLARLKPRLATAQKAETEEMMNKLKGMGNSILGECSPIDPGSFC